MVRVLYVMYIRMYASSQGAANLDHCSSDFYCKNSIPMWTDSTLVVDQLDPQARPVCVCMCNSWAMVLSVT